MQNVFIKQENFNFFQKNIPLTLEQANWFVLNEGFIPLPRKSDKENVKVIFQNNKDSIYLKFKNQKITKYRISEVLSKEYMQVIGFIITIELKKAKGTNIYHNFLSK